MGDSGVDEQENLSPERQAELPRRGNYAKRGYWVPGGRGGASNSRLREATPVTGIKRQLTPDNEEEVGSTTSGKTRRVISPIPPTPMEVSPPAATRRTSSTSSSGSSEPGEPAASQRDPAPGEGLPIGIHSDMVHLVFPLNDVRVPVPLRAGTRPVHPYPFTGEVVEANRVVVRRVLEEAWIEEAARQRSPTVGSVASMLQLRTLWRWEQGWRRSRVTGQWLFMGDYFANGFNDRLITETEDRSCLRGIAMRRLATMARDDTVRGPFNMEEDQRLMRLRLLEVRERLGRLAEGNVPRRAGNLAGSQAGMQGGAQAMPQQVAQPVAAQRAQSNVGARPLPFPEFPWSRGTATRGRGRGRARNHKKARGNPNPRSRTGVPGDPWLELMGLMARHPEVFEWLHRVRTTQHLLMMAHPNREHIRRVVQSEEARSADLARSLIQGQEMTGAATMLDIAWPPSRFSSNTIVMGQPGMYVPGAEISEESEDEADYYPPPHCAPWRGRGGRGHRGGRGGRGGGGLSARF